MSTFDRQAAEKLGWTLAVDGEDGHAEHEDGRAFDVTSGVPLFVMLAEIAEIEGKPFAEGRGGDQPVTPALIQKVSGEDYVEPTPEPTPAPTPSFAEILMEHLAGIDPAAITATDPLSRALRAAIEAERAGRAG